MWLDYTNKHKKVINVQLETSPKMCIFTKSKLLNMN